MSENTQSEPRSPLEMLAPMAIDEAHWADGTRQAEFYTMRGLLRVFWSGPEDAETVAIAVGGAMGGVLGPAKSLYHDLAMLLPGLGIGMMRVDYRKPGDLERCLIDVAAAAELAGNAGARRYAFLGHSFGGAVAIQAAAMLREHTVATVTFATQSAGCEAAPLLAGTPLLLLHGDSDAILGPENSVMVQAMAGGGDLEVFPGADHLLVEAATEIRDKLESWLMPKLLERDSGSPEAP